MVCAAPFLADFVLQLYLTKRQRQCPLICRALFKLAKLILPYHNTPPNAGTAPLLAFQAI